MVETPLIFKSLQGVVLEPSISGAFWLIFGSFMGEVVAPFPAGVFFTGQLLFLSEVFSLALFIKLLFLVALPLAIGSTVGSLFSYGIAYFGGKPAIEKFKKYLRFSWDDVQRLESKFNNNWYDEILFVGLRVVPFIPTIPVNILAGILRMNIYRYLLLTFIGTVIRMIIMILFFGFGGGSGLINILNL